MERFVEAINWCGLRDIGFTRPKFTWLYQRADGIKIRERLDRALATQEWRVKFPRAKLFHLTSVASNHSPLSLHMESKSNRKKVGKVFRFESMWLKDPRCKEVV